ncbi:hypothetical protein [Capnocytophaga gingivalis]|uniref:DUF4832 domain-containing protein n=1 Tax=Capnocytophaga gingivalis TaxID=1017 RepID=A0ABU5YBU0_9FLAO|nr:hypothetical protein [Capnocytophaga gingivalis]MEB3041433.1 hypothetical protein [Capnocytophaga gingivalis]
MKNIILTLAILLFNCHNAQNTGEMKIQQIPLEKQITYGISLSMRVPYELYINDIKADCDYVGANSGVDMNPYILKNGKYKVKLRIFPAFKAGEKLIASKDIKNSNISFGSYIRNKETDEILNYEDKLLPITAPTIDVPYFEQEWEVEITKLPYELEGWSKGQDLRKWDKDKLEKKVVAYYQKLWRILNNGEGEKYVEVWKKADQELFSYYYTTQERYLKLVENTIEDVEEYCKGTMIPLEDYEMKLYAEGKLVCLERKTHTKEFNNKSPLDIKGWSPLISKGEKSGAADYPVKLYLPEGSNEFVIIRP